MEKQNKKEEVEKPAKEALPLGIMLDQARDEVGSVVLQYLNSSGIPPSLFDYVLGDITMKIKDLKTAEYAAVIKERDQNDEH